MLKWLFNKKSTKRGFAFSDEDRAKSIVKRRENKAILTEKKLLQEEYEDLLQEREMALLRRRVQRLRGDEDEDDDDFDEEDEEEIEETPDSLMGNLLTQFAMAQQMKQQQPQQQKNDVSQRYVNLTDDEIKHLVSQVPKQYLKMAKVTNDETIKKVILAKLPALDDDTLERAVKMVKQ